MIQLQNTTTRQPAPPAGLEVTDHSVHGLVTVRQVGAPPRVVASLAQELGPSRGAAGEPDICVTFVEQLPRPASLRLGELNGAPFAFDDESFYLLDKRGRRTRLALGAPGELHELVCERGVGAVPLLVHLVALQLLHKGHVLLHSSSFLYGGKGVLVTGWQTGGKTEMLLAFMARGATYMSDEWTIVGADGSMRGLAAELQLWDWHLQELPQYWPRISPADRRRLRLARMYQQLYSAVPAVERGRSLPLRALKHLHGVSRSVGRAAATPEALFGEHVSSGPAPLERVFLASIAPGGTSVAPIAPAEVAGRMLASQVYERRRLADALTQRRYAFPAHPDGLLEWASAQEQQLLNRALARTPAFEIRHPYPVSLQELFAAALPVCR